MISILKFKSFFSGNNILLIPFAMLLVCGPALPAFAAGTHSKTEIIKASAGAGGKISPSGSVSVTYGSSETFTVTPNAGNIPVLTVDGTAVTLSSTNTYTLSDVTTSHTIVATFWNHSSFASQTGTFTITFNAIPTVNDEDTVVGLSQNVASAYSNLAANIRFNSSGDIDVLNAGTYAAASTLAYKAGSTYSISMVVNLKSSTYTIYVTPPGKSKVTLATNYAFSNSGVTSLAYINKYSDYVGNDVVLSNISLSTASTPVNGTCGTANGVTVTSVPSTNLCSTGTATAISGTGPWSWSCVGSSNGGTTASCAAPIQTETITASAGSNGTLSPSGIVSIKYGASQTFIITPSTGYTASLTVDGTAVTLSNNTYALTNITASHTIAVSFTLIPIVVNGSCGTANGVTVSSAPSTNLCSTGTATAVSGSGPWSWSCDGSNNGGTTASCAAPIQTETITASAGSNGTISPSGSVIVGYGASQTFTVTPAAGYTATLTVDGAAVTLTNNTYNLTNVTAAHTVAASFALQSAGTSLVGWWKFTDGSGSSAADSSGSGNTGTLENSPSWVAGNVWPYALSFNGSNNGVLVNNSSSLNLAKSNLSIALWMKVSSNNSTYREIVRKGTSSSLAWFLLLNGSNNLALSTSANGLEYNNGFPYPADGQWHHVAGVYNGTSCTMYLDGAVKTSYPCGIPNNDVSPVSIGYLANTNIQYFAGSMDDVRVYNGALSAAQVAQLYTTVNNNPPQTEIITASAGTGGTISPTGSVAVNFGANQTFTVTPNAGYTPSLKVDGNAVTLTNNTYTLNDVTVAHTVAASFTLTPVNATCGTANGVESSTAPSANLCATGTLSSAGVTESGTTLWNWTCNSSTGGSNASCSAQVQPAAINGTCGSANGTSIASAPSTNLCSSGIATAVSGSGPWTWTCTEENGGTSANCSAQSSIASSTFTVSSPANGATVSGTINITGTAGSQWVNTRAYTTGLVALSLDVTPSGGSYALSVNTAQLANGTNSIMVVAFSVPAGQSGGTSSTITLSLNVQNAAQTETITASAGSNGTISPSGAVSVNYGASQTFTVTPSTGYTASLTEDGAVVTLSDNTYTLTNVTTTHTIAASFTLIPVVVNGACGTANGVESTSAPTSNLCASGTATPVTEFDTTLWDWTCNSNTGGSNANCSAPVQSSAINGNCGSVNGTSVTSVPSTNLCSSGIATAVSGSGPWAWSCTGENGGTAAPCSAYLATKLATHTGIPSIYDPNNNADYYGNYNSFVSAMGQEPNMYMTYTDYTHPLSSWVSDQTTWNVPSFEQVGLVPSTMVVLGLGMGVQGDNADTDFQAIASGAWDSTINGIFQAWASAYPAFYIRPGHEMNGNWYPWSVTSANAADYAAAFAHIATLAHNFTGARITVVWNPNVGTFSNAPMTSYYPGDAYVDVIGLDIYAFNTSQDTSPSAVSTGPSDVELPMIIAFAKAHNKPFSLPEAGAAITDAVFPANLANVIAGSKVVVDYVGWWDYDDYGDTPPYADSLEWSTNPTSSAAWKAAYKAIAQASAAAQ